MNFEKRFFLGNGFNSSGIKTKDMEKFSMIKRFLMCIFLYYTY